MGKKFARRRRLDNQPPRRRGQGLALPVGVSILVSTHDRIMGTHSIESEASGALLDR